MPPASASAGNNNNAAIQAAKAEREERLRGALQNFILKERQRKKEEYEAKVEEERLRKEREARDRQNDMTLEDTRSQITKMEDKLTDLRNQKQQLFLQLKKVLNEDETRKKQQKDKELLAFQTLQAQQANANAPAPQVFLPPVRHHQMPLIPKPLGNQPMKRGRTPSPPSHHNYYKSSPYAQTKHDDGRRNADYARVLWNKPPTQYPTPVFYQASAGNGPPPSLPDARGAVIYPAYNLPLRQGYHLELQPTGAAVGPAPKSLDVNSSKPTQVYHINLDQPLNQNVNSSGPPGAGSGGSLVPKPQVTMEKVSTDRFHTIEVKHEVVPPGHGPPPPHGMPEGVVYTPLLPGMTLHPMQLPNQTQNNNKSGSAAMSASYAQARNAASAHEQQIARQQQMSGLPPPPQSGQQTQQQQQQQIHYSRRFI